jgi:adenylate kinase family enzyme
MRKILIMGLPGAGKTTLATALRPAQRPYVSRRRSSLVASRATSASVIRALRSLGEAFSVLASSRL